MESRGDPANGMRILFARPSGEVIIVSPAAPRVEGMSDEDYMQLRALRARECALQAGEQWARDAVRIPDCDQKDIPTRWRAKYSADGKLLVASAIRWDGAKLAVDLPTARQHVLNDVAKVVPKDKLDKVAAELETLDLPALETYKPKEV